MGEALSWMAEMDAREKERERERDVYSFCIKHVFEMDSFG
jgi:hypothetical protein